MARERVSLAIGASFTVTDDAGRDINYLAVLDDHGLAVGVYDTAISVVHIPITRLYALACQIRAEREQETRERR